VTECCTAPEGLAGNKSRTKSHSKRPCCGWSDNSSLQKKTKKSICLMTRLEQECSVGVRIRFVPPLLANLDDTFVWKNNEMDHRCGFVVCSSHGDLTDSELADHIKQKLLGGAARDFDVDALRRAVYDFICMRTDSLNQVIDSVALFHKNKGRTNILFGEGDLPWWNANRDRPGHCRGLAFFRRLAQPLCLKFVEGKRLLARGSEVSILDVLIDIPEIREFVVDAIVLLVCCRPDDNNVSEKEKIFFEKLIRALSRIVDWGQNSCVQSYHDVARFVCRIRPELADRLPGLPATQLFVPIGAERLKSLYRHKITIWKEYMSGIGKRDKVISRLPSIEDSKSGDRRTIENRCKLMEQRHHLIESHRLKSLVAVTGDSSVRMPVTSILPRKSDDDRSLLYTDRDMHLSDFIANVHFMNKVNASLPRLCIPGKSRPRLQKVLLATDTIHEIRRLFFDDDGSLRDDIMNDIDLSPKHGFINFENQVCFEERRDQRWQVPIRKHGIGFLIPTRKAVERILSGVFNPETEVLDDLGILIGGTEDQALHHDVARQCVYWLPEKCRYSGEVDTVPVGGWELERLDYNEAMSSPNAPASLVVGMGDATEVLLGVQNDQTIRVAEKVCCIKGGVDNEYFEIVRENKFLVVVRAQSAVMFTGDFPHAGVRNVKAGSSQEQLLSSLNNRIAKVLEQYPDDDPVAQTKAVVAVLCRFPNLDQLCRLHCSSEMTNAKLSIPANTVGFSDCLANTPDTRCLESDEHVVHNPRSVSQRGSPRLVICGDEDTADESGADEEWEDTGNDKVRSIAKHLKRKGTRH
jgi:hypothetical protein